MNKYLIEILKIRTSVILPGLGGFMIANSKTGQIIINKHLKFDDGILAKFIAQKESIDKVEAKNMVSKFVREIEAELKESLMIFTNLEKLLKEKKVTLFLRWMSL